MKILISYSELINRGVWRSYCDMVGLSYYAVNEGADADSLHALSEEDAIKINLIIPHGQS